MLTLSNSTFTRNVADTLGGAVYTSGTTLGERVSLVANGAVISGGAIYLKSGSLDLQDANFIGNGFAPNRGSLAGHVPKNGGAVGTGGGTATIRSSTFYESTADFGGAWANLGGRPPCSTSRSLRISCFKAARPSMSRQATYPSRTCRCSTYEASATVRCSVASGGR